MGPSLKRYIGATWQFNYEEMSEANQSIPEVICRTSLTTRFPMPIILLRVMAIKIPELDKRPWDQAAN